HSDLDVRLQQRAYSRRRAGLLCHGAGRTLLSSRWYVERAPGARGGIDRAVDLDGFSLPNGQLRAAAQLRDFRRARVLRPDDDWLVHSARETPRCGTAVPRARVSGPPRRVHRADDTRNAVDSVVALDAAGRLFGPRTRRDRHSRLFPLAQGRGFVSQRCLTSVRRGLAPVRLPTSI